jgi:hypothetical protein
MAKKKRNIGAEILQGLREIKRGEFGRVIKVPSFPKPIKKKKLSR